MYIKKDYDFYELKRNSWCGAVNTLKTIEEYGKENELMQLLEDIFGNNGEETQINDFLWFEDEYIFEELGINEDEEEKKQ